MGIASNNGGAGHVVEVGDVEEGRRVGGEGHKDAGARDGLAYLPVVEIVLMPHVQEKAKNVMIDRDKCVSKNIMCLRMMIS